MVVFGAIYGMWQVCIFDPSFFAANPLLPTVPLEETFGSGGFGKRAKCGVDRFSLGFYALEFLCLEFSKMWIFCILVEKWCLWGSDGCRMGLMLNLRRRTKPELTEPRETFLGFGFLLLSSKKQCSRRARSFRVKNQVELLLKIGTVSGCQFCQTQKVDLGLTSSGNAPEVETRALVCEGSPAYFKAVPALFFRVGTPVPREFFLGSVLQG